MEFEDYSRDFRKKVNLNFVCRVFDCCAVLAFVGGVLITLTYGIHKNATGEMNMNLSGEHYSLALQPLSFMLCFGYSLPVLEMP